MKKILLFGILIISSLVFGKINTSNDNEGELKFKAEVLKTLALQNVSSVNFGFFIKGQTQGKSYPHQDFGGFEVKGVPNKVIAVYVKDDDGIYEKAASPESIYNVALVKDGGELSNKDEVIDALINVLPEGEKYDAENMTLDSENGIKRFSVGGKIDSIRSTQKVGIYRGYICIKVQYE